VAALALIIRAIMIPFPDALHQWRQIIVFISVLSMALGAFAAIGQDNIKRLIAYSSIGHMGYALLGLAAGTQFGVQAMLVYVAYYAITNIGVFVCIQAMQRYGEPVESIGDLAGLSRTRPGYAFAMSVLMLSLAGLPPLAGIFAKIFVFLAAVEAHLYVAAVLGFLASCVAAYYYLRICAIIYFKDPASEPFDRPMGRGLGTIMALATAFSLLFAVWPSGLFGLAGTAAQALFR
jgi:NADH-quinone oxidoreductase subunit N